jgi:hypothetical protein
MSAAPRLDLESRPSKGLYLVPPDDPPTFPRPPRLPRADPPDSTPTEATEKEILRSIKSKVDVVYQDFPRLETAFGELKREQNKFGSRQNAQGTELSKVRLGLNKVERELEAVVLDVDQLKKSPPQSSPPPAPANSPSVFPRVEPGWNDIRARGENSQVIALEAAQRALRQHDLEQDAKLYREAREMSKGDRTHVRRAVFAAVAIAVVIGAGSVTYVAITEAARAHLRAAPSPVAPR